MSNGKPIYPPVFQRARECVCDDGGTPYEDEAQKDIVCLKCGKPVRRKGRRRAG